MIPRILVTGFKPFGLYGKIFNRNESEVFAMKLKEAYPFINVLILPVQEECKSIIKKAIKLMRPNLIFMLGSAGYITRIETNAYNGSNKLQSPLAKDIKRKVKDIRYEHIGDWYCNDVYYEALSKIPNTIFVHLSHLPSFERIEQMFKLAIENNEKHLNTSNNIIN